MKTRLDTRHLLLLAATAALPALVLATDAGAQTGSPDQWCKLAAEQLTDGDIAAANDLFNQALDTDPAAKCAKEGLAEAAGQQAQSVRLSDAGEELIASGDTALASIVLRASHALDNSNTAAVDGLDALGTPVDAYDAARRLDEAGFDSEAREAAASAARELGADEVPDDLADNDPTLTSTDENLKSLNSVLAEFLKLAALALGVLAIIAAALVLAVSFCSWRWLDWIRRRVWFFRRFFEPRFRIEDFDGNDGAADKVGKIGASVASLITDEISQAQPGGVGLDKADVDATDGAIASQLSQTLPHANLLFAVAARFLRFRRYTVRGTVHPPTKQWVSLTIEILDSRQRVLVNETIYDDVLAADDGDPAPYYLLVPAAAAWLVYTLHDITTQPSDHAWRRARWHPTKEKLRLVGTPFWSSYGSFRRGFWLETFDRDDLARVAYNKALHQDRRNVGALINLASLDIRNLTRLDIATQRLNQAGQLLDDEAATANAAGAGAGAPKRYRIDDLNRARLAPTPDSDLVYGTKEATAPRTQLLWYRVAYLRAVTKLHQALKPDTEPSERVRLIDEAFDDTIALVRAQSTVLLAFEAPARPPTDTTEQEGALVELALQSELTALTLLLALTLESPNPEPPTTSDPTPELRWTFLATMRRSDLTFQRVLNLIHPERPISYQARYNLACAYARRAELLPDDTDPDEDRTEALKQLRVALDGEPGLLGWARTGDPALNALRTDPRFTQLMDEFDHREPTATASDIPPASEDAAIVG